MIWNVYKEHPPYIFSLSKQLFSLYVGARNFTISKCPEFAASCNGVISKNDWYIIISKYSELQGVSKEMSFYKNLIIKFNTVLFNLTWEEFSLVFRVKSTQMDQNIGLYKRNLFLKFFC